jgi:4-amino-4-deoxy-L-arabinose transferase-like glycosyltransferase
MSVQADGQDAHEEPDKAVAQRKCLFRSWLFSYEIYIILIVAAFLRLYGIQTTEFDADQADIFRMAHDAVIHGHLVATSNIASIGIYNPPGIIYALMIPAALSANPIGGAIETALLAVLGVFLTYWFTRRYYGRVAATIASSLFAITSVSLFYSRFMWNQNLLLCFVPLFMLVLFRGVVDRKPGWLFPAIFLYGLLFEWHGSSLLLAAPLVVTWLLAPKTVRWRDIGLGILSLLVLYAPYILWLISTHFAILSLLSQVGTAPPPVVDNQFWLLYLHFITPYDLPFTNKLALLYNWQNFFNWLIPVMTYLIIAAAAFALLLVLFLSTRGKETIVSRTLNGWWRNMLDLRASPYRCGLLVLLVWQAFPLIMLIKHTLSLYPHYLIILMPGPFILIGICIARVAGWFYAHRGWQRLISTAIYSFAAILILLQGIAGTASVIDIVQGNFDDHQMSSPFYNDLTSVQNALTKANRLVQQYHAGRLIVVAATNSYANERMSNCIQAPKNVICQNVDWYDRSMRGVFQYFTDQMQISSTVVDDTCLLLPGPSSQPAVILVPPYEPVIDSFFSSTYTHIVQSETSNRLGGAPFHLYVVDPLPKVTLQTTLSSNIQLVDAQTQPLQNGSSAVVRWNVLQSAPANGRAIYMYKFTYASSKQTAQLPPQVCTVTNIEAGEQLVTLLPHENVQSPLSVQVARAFTTPYIITLHIPFSLSFDTFQQNVIPFEPLKNSAGQETIAIPLHTS